MTQSDEVVVYGTPAYPMVQTQDVKQFFSNIFHKSPLHQEIMSDMFSVFDNMSTPREYESMEIQFDTESPQVKEGEFVPIVRMNEFAMDIEEAIQMPPEYMDFRLHQISEHLPYSQYENEWKEARERFRTNFSQPPVLSERPYKKAFDDIITDKKGIDKILQDPSKYELKPVQFIQAQDVVGSGDETPSSTLKHRLQQNDVLKKLRRIIDSKNRNFFHQRFSIFSARWFIILLRIHQFGFYIPDSIMRYWQDTKFKQANPDIKPRSRKLFKNEYFKNGSISYCQMCTKRIDANSRDWERSHIIPSNKNLMGSNGSHNFIICCRSCNLKTGNMDPFLHKDFQLCV
jgi:hypothetical protein